MNNSERSRLQQIYCHGLLDDVLPFWIRHCVDREQGGFMMALDQDGTLLDTDKSVWQQGRFTWLLGELFNKLHPNPAWLELARHGIQFIENCCFDSTDGRMWFQLDRAGNPLRKRRYSYSESFAAIAYGELFQATGDPAYATRAGALFQQFINHNQNPASATPKFTNTRPTRSIGPPMITLATAQELRTLSNSPMPI